MQDHIVDVLLLIFVINICLLSYRLTEIVVTLNKLILSCVWNVKGIWFWWRHHKLLSEAKRCEDIDEVEVNKAEVAFYQTYPSSHLRHSKVGLWVVVTRVVESLSRMWVPLCRNFVCREWPSCLCVFLLTCLVMFKVSKLELECTVVGLDVGQLG